MPARQAMPPAQRKRPPVASAARTAVVRRGRALPVGGLLRSWRMQRGLSQLELALEAGVSARHVSFVETGRSRPSAQMIERLADQLHVPMPARNRMLLAAGHAPEYDAGHLPRSSTDPMLALDRVASAREPEIEASRARIIAAADEARRQLERDLHDGAQQRFVLASLWLRRAAAKARGTPAEPLVAEAVEQLEQGLAELRDLAHGLHPAVLGEHGLGAALAGLVARSPLPVALQVTPRRTAPALEAAIYFTVAEALTNVAKHAHATCASARVDITDSTVVAEVSDDGIGGATIAAGSGLRGIADRLDAHGGTLLVRSVRAAGTTIRASVPLPSGGPNQVREA
jgi:signal transduction histidine kinase